MKNRELKFRVWDEELKTWIYNIGMMQNNILCDGTEKGRFHVMQFTGLKDKNGKEIYEGDEVIQYIESIHLDKSDWENIKGVVKMIDGQFCVGYSQFPLYGFANEIIGNIHEVK